VGGRTGSRDHRGNPKFSEHWVSQCGPSGGFIHDRGPSSRYKGGPVPEFQEILFLNVISAVIVRKTPNSLWNATMVRQRRARRAFTSRTGLLREEVGCTVSAPAEINEEIHALCEALIASEGRLAP
jgi:hypothetical protein